MKTVKNIYPLIYDWDNLYLAYRKARRGKRSRVPAATFEYDQESNLVQLQADLRSGHYVPGGYHSFFIHEPKHRLISAAPFRDRVVHIRAQSRKGFLISDLRSIPTTAVSRDVRESIISASSSF